MNTLTSSTLAVGSALFLIAGVAGSAHASATAEPLSADGIVIVEPSPDRAVGSAAPTFRGTGTAGAPVVVTDGVGTVLCAARVSADGWSCTSVVDMADGPTQVTAVQNAWGRVSADDLAFTVKRDPAAAIDFPMASWVTAAATVFVLVFTVALIMWRRIRRSRRGRPRRRSGVQEATPA